VLKFTTFFFLILSRLIAAPHYVPADNTRALIQLEKLPLDIAALHQCAKNLLIVASEETEKSAENLRQKAKMLTLAQRLHPSLVKTNTLINTLIDGGNISAEDDLQIATAKKFLRKNAAWLLQTPEDSEGHRLGFLFSDILGELSEHATPDWAATIAPLSEFQNLEIEEISPADAGTQYLLARVESLCPLVRLKSEFQKTNYQLQPLILRTLAQDTPEEVPTSPPLKKARAKIYQKLEAFFANHQKTLPKNSSLHFDTSIRNFKLYDETHVYAPLAMMIDSALSGKALRPDTLLIAQLNTDGTLTAPPKGWMLMSALERAQLAPGTRIIVSSDMQEELLGILTKKNFNFFLKYDILSAKNFEEARSLFYHDETASTAYTEAITPFLEVREKAPATKLQSFLSHESVHSRLMLASKAPQFLSAKFLLLASNKKIPTTLSPKVFAQELHTQLSELNYLKKEKVASLKIANLYEELYTELGYLNKMTPASQRNLMQTAFTLTKRLSDISERINKGTKLESTRQSIASFREDITAFRASLETIYAAKE